MRAYIVVFFAIIFLCILLGAALGTALADPNILYLIHVHGPDGKQEVEINVHEISSIRQPREDSAAHFAPGVRCLIYMTNGQFVPTSETCREIVKLIAKFEERRDDK